MQPGPFLPGLDQCERPPAALPDSFFWTWDHSTNWVLDDPGVQNAGCYNAYLKGPETFVEDYRRLTNLAADLGVPGIVVWGFLRDAHGGVEAGKQVAGHAVQRGVRLMPGVGVTWYGGVYYEGDHPCSLRTFLDRCPEARMLDEHGQPQSFAGEYGACAAHPDFQAWLREAMAWLYREFAIGGVNLENGDMLVDHHPLMQASRADWPREDSDEFFCQALAYQTALAAVPGKLADTLATYATYTGFAPTDRVVQNQGMGRTVPAMFARLPEDAVCQWTLTGMIEPQALPLTAYLDDGAPTAALDTAVWPAAIRPPATRNVGFIHQGSQWHGATRYHCVIGQIKEACLRAHRAGLRGVSIHGEVTSRHIPAALNYLAFSHFIHWPQDSLRQFGQRTLGPVLGAAESGQTFIEILAHWQAGTLTPRLVDAADPARQGFAGPAYASLARGVDAWQRCQFWRWLHAVVRDDSHQPGRVAQFIPF